MPRYRPGAVFFEGRPICFADNASFLSAWAEIFVNRCYQISATIGEPLLIDVGANIGLAPMFWKTCFQQFRYIGFEPDPAIAAICRENLAAWKCVGTLHQAAVTGAGTSTAFEREGADSGRVVSASDTGDTTVVPTVQLSSFLDEPVDLLKVDIEGTEYEVLEEARDGLVNVQNVFVESHTRVHEVSRIGTLISLLEAAGFHCCVHTGKAPEQPFLKANRSGETFDCLLSIFGRRRR